MKKLLILGAGGYGKTIADLASQLGRYDRISFLDDGQSGEGILGKCEDYSAFSDENTDIYPAFGNNTTRMSWLERLQKSGMSIPTLVHPRAYVSPTASLGEGTMVLPTADSV